MSIYFIQCGTNGPIKIGYTDKDPKERMAQLQTACPYELKLLWVTTEGDQESEQFIHEELKHEHIRGEWFRPGKDVISILDECDNETSIKLFTGESIEISEGFNKRIFMSSPHGELVFDMNDNSISINPFSEHIKINVHKWWNK